MNNKKQEEGLTKEQKRLAFLDVADFITNSEMRGLTMQQVLKLNNSLMIIEVSINEK